MFDSNFVKKIPVTFLSFRADTNFYTENYKRDNSVKM